MADSSKGRQSAKPYPDYPLTLHKTGQWAKVIRGKRYYFGTDADEALKRYLAERDYLRSGLPVPQDLDGLTVADICNSFLTAKELELQAGEIGQRHFNDLLATCERIVQAFDGKIRMAATLTPQDFEQLRASLASRYGATRLANEITRVKSVFKYAWDAALLERPVRFGPTFKKPAKKRFRAKRQHDKLEHGARMFTPEQLRTLIAAADVHLRAMIYLGVQGGMLNSDVGTLPLAAVDLDKGWIDYPRPKNLVERRFPLWPETVQALRESLSQRPKPRAGNEGLFFITAQGTPYWSEVNSRWVGQKFKQLLERTQLYRPNLSFRVLRPTFRTVADACRDRPAVDLVMGHTDHSVAWHYREEIDDARLLAVVNTVRAWLWPESAKIGG